jgi:multidrug efflux system membrane fusion protein
MEIKKLSRRRLALALLAIAVLAASGAIKRMIVPTAAAVQPKSSAPVPATTVRVAQEDVPILLSGVGTAQAGATVVVKTRVDGQLDRINFTEGQEVKAGQVLAQLDSRTFEAQLAQVSGQKARDEALLANAKLDLQRYNTLIKIDATTQQVLDTQRALVNQLEAAVETDRASVKYAKVQLAFTTISAPLSGRLGARLVDPGNIVHANDANGLVVINQVDPISVVFTLPEAAFQDINHALQSGRHELTVYAYSRDNNQKLGKGALVLLNNQIDTNTGTVQLKARFSNPSRSLWPGQYVNVRLLLGMREQALTVPAGVVQRGQSGTYAYVVKPDLSVKLQPIQVVQIDDGKAIIGKGLNGGERVVLDGQYKLKPGNRIVESVATASRDDGQGALQ